MAMNMSAVVHVLGGAFAYRAGGVDILSCVPKQEVAR